MGLDIFLDAARHYETANIASDGEAEDGEEEYPPPSMGVRACGTF